MLRAEAQARGLAAIVSTDGDGDRPLVTDATGEVVPGDLLGQITARMLGVEVVVTPVSSNTGAEAGGHFARGKRATTAWAVGPRRGGRLRQAHAMLPATSRAACCGVPGRARISRPGRAGARGTTDLRQAPETLWPGAGNCASWTSTPYEAPVLDLPARWTPPALPAGQSSSASTIRSASDTQPKIPPCALIISSATR